MERLSRNLERQPGALRGSATLAAYAGTDVTFESADLLPLRQVRDPNAVSWTLSTPEGDVQLDPGAQATVHVGRPMVADLTASSGAVRRTKRVVFGVHPKHLIENLDAYDDFFYAVTFRLAEKAYFLPLVPDRQRSDLAGLRNAALREMSANEPAYRAFAQSQDRIYACQTLQQPRFDPDRLAEGAYAVFSDEVLFLGTAQELNQAIQGLRSALDFDAQSSVEAARPGRVFAAINALADTFDPRALVNAASSTFLTGALESDRDAAWMGGNLSQLFDAFRGHLSSLGLASREAAGVGCLFGYNTRTAALSSRFSDPGLGIARHSINTLSPSAGRGPGSLVSLRAMYSDDSARTNAAGLQYVPGAYWDSGAQALVLGASSPREIRSIDFAAVNSRGDVVIVVTGPPGPGSGPTGGGTGGPTGEEPAEPAPAAPARAGPAPAAPAPAEPAPAEPAPAEPTRVEPTRAGPTPVGPTPVGPTRAGQLQEDLRCRKGQMAASGP